MYPANSHVIRLAGDADEPAPKPKKRPPAKSKAKSSERKPAAAKKG